MTDQSETPKILEQISKGTSAGAGGTRKQQNARRRFIIVLVLLVPLLAAVAFLGYTQFQLQTEIANIEADDSRVIQLEATIADQQAEIQELRELLDTLPEPDNSTAVELQALATRVDAELAELGSQVAGLSLEQLESVAPQDSQWKILEANYLARMAAQKLELEGDIGSAIVLMERSDAALVASGSSNVIGVRQQLTRDLEVLRNTPALDREAIVFQLQALVDRIDGLDLLTSQRENYMNRRNAQSESVDLGSDSVGILDSTLDFLGSVFVWRKWEDTPDAMLIPGQETVIKQSFRLMLEQAQLAALNSENGLYQRHLANAREWLNSYALLESDSGKAALADLSELSELDVNPRLPSLSASLTALDQLSAAVR